MPPNGLERRPKHGPNGFEFNDFSQVADFKIHKGVPKIHETFWGDKRDNRNNFPFCLIYQILTDVEVKIIGTKFKLNLVWIFKGVQTFEENFG
jgi:hypothetical protein